MVSLKRDASSLIHIYCYIVYFEKRSTFSLPKKTIT